MDNSAERAILLPDMLRRLLTIFAILTGLAAASAPAQAAQMNEVTRVRVVAAAELVSRCTLPSSGPALAPPAPQKDSAKAPCPKPRPPVVLPPVMLRVDRSLE
jgi:hypothetical protein